MRYSDSLSFDRTCMWEAGHRYFICPTCGMSNEIMPDSFNENGIMACEGCFNVLPLVAGASAEGGLFSKAYEDKGKGAKPPVGPLTYSHD